MEVGRKKEDDDPIDWNLMPRDNACEIISHITNVGDIINFMKTSSTFINLAMICVKELTSEKLVSSPLSNFTGFTRLARSNENVLLLLEHIDNIAIITQLFRLVEANFYFAVNTETEFSDMVISIINGYLTPVEEVSAQGEVNTYRRSLDNAMIRIIANIGKEAYAVIIDHNKIMLFMVQNPATNALKDTIASTFNPLVVEFYYGKIYSGFNLPFGLMDNLTEFIQEGNFGLVEPSNPPSVVTNPTLKSQLKLIGSGFSSSALLTPLLAIYAIVNNLSLGQTKLILSADDNIREHFQKVVDEYNQSAPTDKQINLSAFRHATFQRLIYLSSTKSKSYDPILPLTKTKYVSIQDVENDQDVTSGTYSKYKDILKRNRIARKTGGNISPIYLPDGSTL